jgi:two-component system, chemotaxis family, CheB/CheR fusion protein
MEKKKRESRKHQNPPAEIAGLKEPGRLMMVGIGASAGGFKPLLNIFNKIPADSGMAYVVILHLSPVHKSNLAELLQKETAIPVTQVQETVHVEPNHIYVIPPNKNLLLEDGVIRLAEPEHARGQRVPIDFFFRSLAEVYRNNAIAVVLSGVGADGTLGMRRIKEYGGLTITQDPREAEQEGMPRSAINAGIVDFVLPIAEIPDKLISLRQNAEQIVMPSSDPAPHHEETADALRELLALVRARTSHDFSSYKRSTILRRIERRLQVNEVKDIPAYLNFMREHQEEVRALLRDLLISVTNFFRDHEAFEALEREVLPRLFDGKTSNDQVRVWVSGCATGEEAYSLAILLCEQTALLKDPPKLQVFATDIDDEAISRARNAVYPETIVADVSPERLKRFFIKEAEHYRIRKDVREIVLFAPHNVLRDPPFSKLDLIACRNLLIYLTREIQERVLEIFHFALRPEGFLFLGSSESADGPPSLFTPYDKKLRIYRRQATNSLTHSFPKLPQAGKWEIKPLVTPVASAAKPFSFAGLHQQILIERHLPPSVLINEDYEILHISGDAGRYLRFVDGEPSRDLLRVVHPSLRFDLRAALFAAKQSGNLRQSNYIRIGVDGNTKLINLAIEPINHQLAAQNLLMVIFDEVKDNFGLPADGSSARPENGGMEPVVQQLEEELQKTRDQLRATIEQYETSVEELKASNEELQAINEELRSATEELETSKEELQSVNEELTTVNHELKEKVDEVSRANSDLRNLMASTAIGTIFLDRALHIKLYTPPVLGLFNIIPSDLNRPLDHLTHKLEYEHLTEDAEHVLATLKVIEREVASSDGRWHLARLLPYRTIDDRIDGIVMTFVDITERKHAEQERERLLGELDSQRTLLDSVLRQMPAGVIIAEAPTGRLILGNQQVERIFRHAFIAGEEVESYDHYKGFHTDGRPYESVEWPLARSIQSGEAVVNEEIEILRGDGTRGWVSVNSAPIHGPEGRIVAAVTAFHDITEHRQFVIELESIRADLEKRVAERTLKLNETNVVLHEEINERRRAEAERTQTIRQMMTALEEERRRISRDLHDRLGQQFTVLKLHLEHLLAQSGVAALREQIEQTQALVQALDKDLDFLAWELRPTALDDLGLAAALGNFVEEWATHFSRRAEFHTSGLDDRRLSHDSETMLYRIAQEALNNIVKHTQADRVEVMLERRGDQVVLIVEDNGIGFDITQIPATNARRGLGLVSMRERAAYVGGTLEIESQPGQGTTIYVRVPFVLTGDEEEGHE